MMDLHRQLALAHGRPRLLLLDYDGTLVPFASAPELARPDRTLLRLLARLTERSDTHVHIVSGRSRSSLEEWLGHLRLGLHAEHGFWQRPDPRQGWVARFPADFRAWMPAVLEAMARAVTAVPGSFVEQKTASVCWHHRVADPRAAEAAVASLHEAMRALRASHPLQVIEGSCVFEVRVEGAHKGLVVEPILRELPASTFVLAVGDDATDEDMFAALPDTAVTVHAGERESRARFRVDGPPAVRRLLEELSEAP